MRRALYLVRSWEANTDAEAFSRIARGDLGALGELYDRYARDLFRFARRAAPDDDAEDVVYMVFERLVRSSMSYDGRSASARRWLFGVTARVLRERRRPIHRFRMALAARLRGARMMPVTDRARGPHRSQLDDVSWRRLRYRTLASADSALKSAPAARSAASRLVVAIASAIAFASALAIRPRLEYARSVATAGPRATTVRVQSPAPVTKQEDPPARAASPESSSTSSPAAASPPKAHRRRATDGSPAGGASGAGDSRDDDGVAEDLAYLRVLALLDEGRKDEAILAARAYLARFPGGFRRVEIRSIALGPLNPSKDSASVGQVHQ